MKCPNCGATLDRYPNCGRCSPPCDNVIGNRCDICGYFCNTYEWETVPTLEMGKNSYTPIDTLLFGGWKAGMEVLYPDLNWYDHEEAWGEFPEEEKKAFRAQFDYFVSMA